MCVLSRAHARAIARLTPTPSERREQLGPCLGPQQARPLRPRVRRRRKQSAHPRRPSGAARCAR
jgi:hypothetical protein